MAPRGHTPTRHDVAIWPVPSGDTSGCMVQVRKDAGLGLENIRPQASVTGVTATSIDERQYWHCSRRGLNRDDEREFMYIASTVGEAQRTRTYRRGVLWFMIAAFAISVLSPGAFGCSVAECCRTHSYSSSMADCRGMGTPQQSIVPQPCAQGNPCWQPGQTSRKLFVQNPRTEKAWEYASVSTFDTVTPMSANMQTGWVLQPSSFPDRQPSLRPLLI
jgi:hypothetical protein